MDVPRPHSLKDGWVTPRPLFHSLSITLVLSVFSGETGVCSLELYYELLVGVSVNLNWQNFIPFS